MISMNDYIEKYSNEQSQHFFNQVSHGVYVRVFDNAKDANHDDWIDDIPVSAGLLYLAINLRLRRRRTKRETVFMPGTALLTGRFFNSLVVSDAEDPEVVLGSISTDSGQYYVSSPQINHPKYKRDAFRRMSVRSENWVRVCAAAVTYFQMPSVSTLMNDSLNDLDYGLRKVKAKAQAVISARLVMSPDDIVAEAQHMIAAGYKPITDQFKKALDTVNSEGSELLRLAKYAPTAAVFVWMGESSVRYCLGNEEKEVSDITQLPGDMAQKLSILNIAGTREPIPDVGMRISNSTYWVFA